MSSILGAVAADGYAAYGRTGGGMFSCGDKSRQ